MARPVWMRSLAVVCVAMAGFYGVSAVAKETVESAAARPVVPIPTVTPPPRTEAVAYPKWSEFPAPPTDVPTVSDIAMRVNTQKAAAGQLAKETRALVWDQEKPEPFANATKGRINPDYLAPVDTGMSRTQIESLAAELRRRVAPPPVADL